MARDIYESKIMTPFFFWLLWISERKHQDTPSYERLAEGKLCPSLLSDKCLALSSQATEELTSDILTGVLTLGYILSSATGKDISQSSSTNHRCLLDTNDEGNDLVDEVVCCLLLLSPATCVCQRQGGGTIGWWYYVSVGLSVAGGRLGCGRVVGWRGKILKFSKKKMV